MPQLFLYLLAITSGVTLNGGPFDLVQTRSQHVNAQSEADPQDDDDKTIDQWVLQLGAQRFSERREATMFLFEMGRKAESALKNGAKSPEIEIRRRCEYLLSLIQLGITAESNPEQAQLVLSFRNGNKKTRETILSRLYGDKKYLALLNLIETADIPFQKTWFSRYWRDRQVLSYQLISEDDSDLEQILFHQVRWNTNLYNTLYLANINDKLSEQKTRWLSDLRGRRKPTEQQLLRAAVLSIRDGGIAEAEPILKRLPKSIRLKLIVEDLARKQDWVRIDQLLEKHDAENEENDTQLFAPAQRLAISRWAGNEKAFDDAVEAMLAEVPDDDPDASRAIIRTLVANCEYDRLNPFIDSIPQSEAVSLLCFLNRYEEAFELLEMGYTVEEKSKWYQAKIDKLMEMTEQLRKRHDAQVYVQVRQEFSLLIQVAFQVGNLGDSDLAEILFSQLAGCFHQNDYRTNWARLETIKRLAQMDNPEIYWMFVETSFRENEVSAAMSSVFGTDQSLAQMWFRELADDVPNVFERVKVVAGLLAHPLAEPLDDTKTNQFVGRCTSAAASLADKRRGLQFFQVGKTLLKLGRDEQGIKLLDQAASLDTKAAQIALAEYYFDHGDFKKSLKSYEGYFSTNRDARTCYMIALCHKKLGSTDKHKQFQRVAEILLFANNQPRYMATQLGKFREQEEVIRYYHRIYNSIQVLEPDVNGSLEGLAESWLEIHPEKPQPFHQLAMLNYLARNSKKTAVGQDIVFITYGRQSNFNQIRKWIGEDKVEQAWDLVEKCEQFSLGDSQLAEEIVPLLEKAEHKDLADELFDRVASYYTDLLDQYPNSALLHNNYAWVCAKCDRRLKESIVHGEKAVKLRSNNSNYVDTLAEVYFLNGRHEKAVELARRAIKLDPTKIHYRNQLKRFESALDRKVN